MARTSLPVFGEVSDQSMRHANTKLTGQNTRVESGESMIQQLLSEVIKERLL